MTIRWGILSTARINDRFIGGVDASPENDVLAVASRDGDGARTYAQQHGIERSYGSYGALLQDPDVEAVYISLPNSLHVEWTRHALRAGKHVLCEKPLSRRAGDVEAVFDLAQQEGRILMEAFMYRHHPQTMRVAELVASGAIGQLRLIRSSFSFPLADQTNVRLRADLDGGALMDVGCYCVNAIRLLAGEPVLASATQVTGGDGVDVAFAAWLRCGNDVLAHFDAGFQFSDRYELEVVGDEASLMVRDPWHCRRPGIERRRGDAVEQIEVPPADSYRLEADNMAAAISGGAAPLLGRADSVGQARAIEALYASAGEGRLVEV